MSLCRDGSENYAGVEYPSPPPRVCISIHHEGESFHDLVRLLVLNDPPARHFSTEPGPHVQAVLHPAWLPLRDRPRPGCLQATHREHGTASVQNITSTVTSMNISHFSRRLFRVTRYDREIDMYGRSIWEIDMGDRTSMIYRSEYRYGI